MRRIGFWLPMVALLALGSACGEKDVADGGDDGSGEGEEGDGDGDGDGDGRR